MADDAKPVEYESTLPEPDAQPPKGALSVIFLIVLMDLLGFGIIIPLLAFYVPNFTEHPGQVTALFSVYSICQFIGAPILGLMSDRFGRRPVLALSQAGSAIGYLLLAVAAFDWHNPGTRLLLVYASRIIDGFTGGNISTAQAYVSDVTTRANRAKGMGLLGAAFGIGFSIGPAVGGLMGGYIGLSAPGYFAAALATIAAVLSWTRLPETRKRTHTDAENWLHPRRFAPVLRKPVLVQLLAIGFFVMFAFVMMESTIAMFLNKSETFGWGEKGVGFYFLFAGIVIVIVQGGLIGRLTKKLGDWPLCITGPFLVSIGMAGLVAVAFLKPHVAFPLLMTILLVGGASNAIGRSLQQPTLSSLLSKFSATNEQGLVFGLYHGLSSLARVFGPLVAWQAYRVLNGSGQFVLAGAITVVLGLWTLALRQTPPHESVPEAPAEAATERG